MTVAGPLLSSFTLAWALAWPSGTSVAADASDGARASEEGTAADWRSEGLSRAMFSHEDEAFPIEVDVVVRDDSGTTLIEVRRTVHDGDPIDIDETFATEDGERGISLRVVPRVHFGARVELEFEIDATEASFAELTWADYLLHRVALGPRPRVESHALVASRADIVQVAGDAHEEVLSTRHGALRIGLSAHTVRG